MGRYAPVPTANIDFMPLIAWDFDTPGGGMDGGRNGLGQTITISTTGGPIVTASIVAHLFEPEHHEYGNMLAGRLNGGFRFVNIPIPSDFMGPFPGGVPIINGIPHSDGSFFSDGSGYSQATVYAELTADAALNAGVISFRLYGASRALRHSDWMSFYHPNKGWRATRYYEVISRTYEENPVYTVAIEVPLREAMTAGDRVEFARPRCVMKLKPGTTIPYSGRPAFEWEMPMQLEEAF